MRQYFPAIFGNRDTARALGESAERSALPHALLIEGAQGSGKRTLAKEIAMAALCESRKDTSHPLPCRSCRACYLIENGLAPDVHYVTRGDRATLGVEAVRDMIEDTAMAATELDYKIYIFEDAHTMTVQAQNALLKVMEEPPAPVKILLLTEDADSMLTTVRSRARLLRMQRFTPEEIRTYLEAHHADLLAPFALRTEELAATLLSAGGNIGRAIALLSPKSQAALQKERAAILGVLSALADQSYSALLGALSALPQKRDELASALLLLHTAVRDLILLKHAEDPPLTFFPTHAEIPERFNAFRAGTLFAYADTILQATDELARNANVSTTVTALALRLRNAQKVR